MMPNFHKPLIKTSFLRETNKKHKSYQLNVPLSQILSKLKKRTQPAIKIPPKNMSILLLVNKLGKEKKYMLKAFKPLWQIYKNNSSNMKLTLKKPKKPWPRHSTLQKMYIFYYSGLKLHHILWTTTMHRILRSKRRQNKPSHRHDSGIHWN